MDPLVRLPPVLDIIPAISRGGYRPHRAIPTGLNGPALYGTVLIFYMHEIPGGPVLQLDIPGAGIHLGPLIGFIRTGRIRPIFYLTVAGIIQIGIRLPAVDDLVPGGAGRRHGNGSGSRFTAVLGGNGNGSRATRYCCDQPGSVDGSDGRIGRTPADRRVRGIGRGHRPRQLLGSAGIDRSGRGAEGDAGYGHRVAGIAIVPGTVEVPTGGAPAEISRLVRSIIEDKIGGSNIGKGVTVPATTRSRHIDPGPGAVSQHTSRQGRPPVNFYSRAPSGRRIEVYGKVRGGIDGDRRSRRLRLFGRCAVDRGSTCCNSGNQAGGADGSHGCIT